MANGKVEEAATEAEWQALCDRKVAYRDIEFVYPEHEGAAIFTRPDLLRATHAKQMRTMGIRTLAEVDDNYLSDPKLNIFMSVNKFSAEARLDHIKATASQDGLIVTTDWLADRYRKELKKAVDFCPPVYVCRNHVDLTQWPTRVESEDGRLRVGFMGSGQHITDVRLIQPACRWAAEQGHEVVFVGLDPKEHVHRDGRLELDKNWTKFPYRYIPWTQPKEYRRTGLPLDVGLVPIQYNDHTNGKSDIKWLEYGMSGAAAVVQNVPLYNKTATGRALLASSPREFLEQTMRLCRDATLRRELVDSTCEYIRSERDIVKNGVPEWREAIDG